MCSSSLLAAVQLSLVDFSSSATAERRGSNCTLLTDEASGLRMDDLAGVLRGRKVGERRVCVCERGECVCVDMQGERESLDREKFGCFVERELVCAGGGAWMGVRALD